MSDLLSAVGILLAIITLFYEKATNAIKPIMEKPIPPKEQKKELEKTRKEIEKGIRTVIVFVIFYFAFSWLLFPTSIVVIFNSKLSLWDFDVANTIFIIVNCTVFTFFIAAVRTIIILFFRRKKCLTTAST